MNAPLTTTPPPAPKMQPPAVLLLGDVGAGKTDVLTTYIEAGKELFVLSTEPGGVESLIDAVRRRKLDMNKLHYATVLPTPAGMDAMMEMVRVIGSQSYEDIAGIKRGIGKEHTRAPAMKILETIGNFRCERTGQAFGDVTTWGPDRAFAFDSLSGLSIMGMMLTVGYKPSIHQGEWGVAMNFVEQLLLKITSDRNCHFALTSHLEKELNEVSGQMTIGASTLGRKLAPKIPRFFSEVVLAKRKLAPDGKSATFAWSNVEQNTALKNRALTIGSDLTPSFLPVVTAYDLRVKQAAAPLQATA